MHLFILFEIADKVERERESKNEKEKEGDFTSDGYFPLPATTGTGTGTKPEYGNFIWISHVGNRHQLLEPLPAIL